MEWVTPEANTGMYLAEHSLRQEEETEIDESRKNFSHAELPPPPPSHIYGPLWRLIMVLM